jgi:CheY-like chemotaxis protein
MDTPATVLLIDDETSFVRGLARLLARDGIRVETAADGQCALAHLCVQRYDIILCDLLMPVLDGPAFYTILRQRDPALSQRVLCLTGDTLGVASTAFLAQCGQPCLYKPCTATAVRRAMEQLLGRAASPVPRETAWEASTAGGVRPEAGTLCLLKAPPGYRVRYAANNAQSPERRPAWCPDAAALTVLLHTCGLDAWSIQQASTELQEGRVAIVPLVCVPTQLDALFPIVLPLVARAVAPVRRIPPSTPSTPAFFHTADAESVPGGAYALHPARHC